MNIYQWIVILGLFIASLIAFFKVAKAVDLEENKLGFLYLGFLLFTVLISLFIVIIVTESNNVLSKENKRKCPEYEQIDAYILKK